MAPPRRCDADGNVRLRFYCLKPPCPFRPITAGRSGNTIRGRGGNPPGGSGGLERCAAGVPARFDMLQELARAFPPGEEQRMFAGSLAGDFERGETGGAEIVVEDASAALADHVERAGDGKSG